MKKYTTNKFKALRKGRKPKIPPPRPKIDNLKIFNYHLLAAQGTAIFMATGQETKLQVFLEREEILDLAVWLVAERPGYQGKRKEQDVERWNEIYGEGNWRLAWQTKNGRIMSFKEVFYEVYFEGYRQYFREHPEEAARITENFSFIYDKDLITQDKMYDPTFLYNVPGKPNQFHHAVINLALVGLGYQFKGKKPLQVREGKPGTPESEWPLGWRWSPGRIPLPEGFKDEIMVGMPQSEEVWWQSETIEDFYQCNKVLQVKRIKKT